VAPIQQQDVPTTTYLEVLDGQRSLYGSELTLVAARGDEYRTLVQLYKALGGCGNSKIFGQTTA
jgi:multidrug efflux system outer membrane protein